MRSTIEAMCEAWRQAERARRHVEKCAAAGSSDDLLALAVARLVVANDEVARLEQVCGVRREGGGT